MSSTPMMWTASMRTLGMAEDMYSIRNSHYKHKSYPFCRLCLLLPFFTASLSRKMLRWVAFTSPWKWKRIARFSFFSMASWWKHNQCVNQRLTAQNARGAHFFPFTSQPLNWRQSRWWMLQLCSRSACSCPANKANHHLFQKVKLCGCELDENFIFRSIRARIVNPNSAVETVTGLHQDLHSNQQQNQWVDS